MLLSAALVGAADAGDAARRARLFPRPASMEHQVVFWRDVFAKYSSHQVVVHDALYLDKIYSVLDFRPYAERGMSEGEIDRLRRRETDAEVARVRAILLRLHALGRKPRSMSAEERRIYNVFRDDSDPGRFRAAADPKRLRTQRGIAERFAEGIRISRRYLPRMEEIFREEGLPVELTRMPLIESCFDVQAYSKVGAAGIWQFIPATGRLFMRVDDVVDERRDPIHSTRAAGRFLRDLHDRFGSWPLAITAYNHGPVSIARAVRQTGSTDIARIVSDYQGPTFGFASRNFYAEFLAALEVERNYRDYFGDLPVDPPLDAREYQIEQDIAIEAAARVAGTNREQLAALNPALSRAVTTGRWDIPRGYRLRIPRRSSTGFTKRLAEFDAQARVTRVATHRVRMGETLSHIAQRHNVSVASLRRANRLTRQHDKRLRPGQVLKIPSH